MSSTALAGHPLFWLIWSQWLPQPYENLALRMLMCGWRALSLLVIPCIHVDVRPASPVPPPRSRRSFWITLPWFFAWMYFCNGGNAVWLASLGAGILIYYHLTDWRLATVGSASAVAVAWAMFQALGPDAPSMSLEQVLTNTVVLAFCWFMGIVLGLSSSNLRREQLNYTLGTMGIMAHELRTPLATMQPFRSAKQLAQRGVREDAARASGRTRVREAGAAPQRPGAQHEPPDRHADRQRTPDAACRAHAEAHLRRPTWCARTHAARLSVPQHPRARGRWQVLVRRDFRLPSGSRELFVAGGRQPA